MWVSVISFGVELSSSANQKQTKYEQQQTEPVKKDSYTQQTTNCRQDVCFPRVLYFTPHNHIRAAKSITAPSPKKLVQ
jgi:hypothetical protein